MATYHVNPKTGATGACRATVACPFGGAEDHHDSAEAARAAFETSMGASFAPKVKKDKLASKKMDALVASLGKPGSGLGSGTLEDPINVMGNTLLAARLLSEGKHVRLNKVHEVGTLLKNLRSVVKRCEALGEEAPTFDLCKVSVPKTNLFCAESKGIPRAQMPQLTGFAEDNSPAARLPTMANGKKDISAHFKAELLNRGVPVQQRTVNASFLKASQAELDGAKVARKLAKARAGKLEDKVIFVTKCGHIIDGHHSWATKVGLSSETGIDEKMTVEMVDMEIGEAIDFTNEYAKYMGIQAKTVGAAA